MNDIKYVAVRDVMNNDIQKIDGMATVTEAVQQMRAAGCGSLIVDKRDDRDEYGLISIGDLAHKVVAPDFAPDRISAYQVMSKPVLTVESKMNVRYAIRLLTRFNISRALVVEHGHAVGIVSLRDMVIAYAT